MSRSTFSIKNKHQHHPKVRQAQYLYNSGEPKDYVSHDSSDIFETELLESSKSMRGEFRHLAQRIREQY